MSAASTPGTSSNAENAGADSNTAAWRRLWRRYIVWATRPGGWLGPIQYEDDEFSDWARR